MKRRVTFHPISGLIFLISICICTGCVSQSSSSGSLNPQATHDLQFEATIEAKLSQINPEAVPVYRDATTALDAWNYDTSETLYEQVLTMAPNFSTAYRRLGYIAGAKNNLEQSVELSRKALHLEPDAYNKSALARSLIYVDTPAARTEAFSLSQEAIKDLPEDEETIMVWLMAAGGVENYDVLRQADERLLLIAPDNPMGHYYAGILAAMDGKWEKSENEFKTSQQLGVPADAIQAVLDSGVSRNAMIFRSLRWGAIATVAWLVGLLGLFFVGNFLSKATLKAINNQPTFIDAQVKPQEKRIRSLYRIVITILSLYFYISIPFVILLVLLLVGGAFYFFMSIETIPIQIAVILLIILFGSLFAILRSVFSRIKSKPLGKELTRIDAPELWALVENVARRLSIRPVDTIVATPYAEIAVNEKGSIFKKLRGSGKRNLLIGVGALSGLSQGQLAAILAHEYGHFSNRDTAGGNLAHQVYASLLQLAQRLAKSGAARIYNPAWLFVLGYERIFLRVTQGASRLQEVLADRYAAMAYGSNNLIEGLQNLIRQTIVFPIQADHEIKNALETHRPIVNIYDLKMTTELEKDCDEKFYEVMHRVTTNYDSHPAPQERIALIERLHIPYSPIQDNPAPALHLFPNSTVLQQEMTSLIASQIKK